MALLHLDRGASESLVDQARAQIVSALHLGKAKAGDRLPSVRSLSRSSGIDPKTAFRIYHALAGEGYVHLRPGSGAYIKEIAPSLLDQARALDAMQLLRRHMAEAEEAGLDPGSYGKLATLYANRRKAVRRDRIAFIECNPEQSDMIAQELSRRLRVEAIPILLSSILHAKKETLLRAGSCRYLVTTDYHFGEIGPWARSMAKRLLCVRLDPRILESMLTLAGKGILGMIVSDTSFLPRFRRSIMRLGLDRKATQRIEAAAASDREGIRMMISRADALYVSPLCSAETRDLVPTTMPVLRPRFHLSTESVESIQALLLFGDSVGLHPRRRAASFHGRGSTSRKDAPKL